MKSATILSFFAFFLFFGIDAATAQSTADSPARAMEFEMAAKATNFSTAYQFTIPTQNVQSVTHFFENYTGIDVVFCSSDYKGAQPGTYRFLVNTTGAQYGIPHIKNMLQEQGFPNVQVQKMQK